MLRGSRKQSLQCDRVSSIPLTGESNPNIVRREMRRSLQCGVPEAVTKKHAWMCLLLPLLLLCNPFLAMSESSGTLSVCHPPSYRAGVASSELLKFKNQETHEGIRIAELAIWEGYTPLKPTLQPCEEYSDTETFSPPVRFLSGNLWFRPPPIA